MKKVHTSEKESWGLFNLVSIVIHVPGFATHMAPAVEKIASAGVSLLSNSQNFQKGA